MNYSKERLIKYLVQQHGIHNQKLIQAFRQIPREIFVPPHFRSKVYEDVALPIGFGQTISRPSTVALMTELLELKGGEKVLEIGTGSGFQAAILAKMGCRVFTIERIKELYERANEIFRRINPGIIVTYYGDGRKGWPSEAPFDRIIVTAAADTVDELLFAQLAEGGLMLVPVQVGDRQELHKFIRQNNEIIEEIILHASFVPLVEGRI